MTETKFKHTDIGLIPEDWEVEIFTNLFDFLSTASYSRADIKTDGDIGYIHYGDIHTKIGYHLNTNRYVSGFVSNKQLKSFSFIQKGDLIMADASEDYSGVGKSCEVINTPKGKVISGLHTFLIREKGERFALGFKGYFHSNPLIKKQYDALATGLKVYSLSKNVFKKIQIPLPPLPEQQAIAEVLSDTDAWIESLEKLIAKKQLIKQGAMQQLLAPKEDWEVKELGSVLLTSPDYGINASSVNYDDTLPVYLRITDIDENGNFLKDNLSSINNTNSGNYYLNKDEIVFARTGASVGKSYLYKESDGILVFAGFLIRLKINILKANSKFVFYNTQTTSYKNWIISNSMRSGQPGINSNEIQNFQFPLPPLPEQTRIATILSDMDAEIEALEQKLAKAQQIKQGLMQELLTGRRRIMINY